MNKTTQSWWFVFYKDQLLLEKKENGTFALPYGDDGTYYHNIRGKDL